MTKAEKRIYRLECELIQKYFKGLRPRPVKLQKGVSFYGQASEPFLMINLARHRTEKELANTLKHELIHYELKDEGKDYHGHGQAFLKRATELDIVGSIELKQCLSAEEYEHMPTRRKWVETPIDEFSKKYIASEIKKLMQLALRLPSPAKIRIFSRLQSLAAAVESLLDAIRRGETCVSEIMMEKKRGPQGKSLQDWKKEFDALKTKETAIKADRALRPNDRTLWKKLGETEGRILDIMNKVEEDYGVTF